MATEIRKAIRDRKHLLLEAPTGEGKSFLMLQEAIALVKRQPHTRVHIATPTKALQDQYAAEAAKAGISQQVAVLKGLKAYVCLREFFDNCPEERQADQLIQITRSGGAIDGPFQSDLKQYTIDHDDCDNEECAHYNPASTDPSTPACFYQAAVRQAHQASIVIVSHAALATHFLLKRRNGSGYLPQADVLMIDEAHAWPRQMTLVLTKQITIARIQAQAQSLIDGKNAVAHTSREVKKLLTKFVNRCADYNQQAMKLLGPGKSLLLHSPWRQPSRTMEHNRLVAQNIVKQLAKALTDVLDKLKPVLKTLPNTPQTRGARRVLKHWTTDLRDMADFIEPLGKVTDDTRHDIMALNRRTNIIHLQRSPATDPHVTFIRHPTTVRRFLYHILCEPTLIIFASGTLRTRFGSRIDEKQQFISTAKELGFLSFKHNEPQPSYDVSPHRSTLHPTVTLHFADEHYPPLKSPTRDSKEDEEELLFIEAQEEGEEEDQDWSTPPDAWLNATTRLLTRIANAPGGIYVLCTSYAALCAIEQRLRACPHFPRQIFAEQPDFTQEPRLALRDRPDQTLVLSASGWEGVDLPAIRHLVIHRLPFNMVDYKLYDKSEKTKVILQLLAPQASIRLRQGIGRAIRTPGDCCDIYILDNRFSQWAKHLLGLHFTTDPQTGQVTLHSTDHALWATTKLATIRVQDDAPQTLKSNGHREPPALSSAGTPQKRSWLDTLFSLGGSRT
jgi:Rad3-related DNA helicase